MSSITAIADEWWARDFACSSTELRPSRTRVQQHAGALLDNPGIWILVAGGAPLISLPSDAMNVLADLAQSWSVSDVADAAGLQSQLVSVCNLPVDKILGPAFIGYGSSDSLDFRDAQLAQQFSSPEAIGRLQAACLPDEWDHGGSQPHPDALGAGLVPQYRTLRQNVPSMGIAKRLGFIEYGFSVYARLRAG